MYSSKIAGKCQTYVPGKRLLKTKDLKAHKKRRNSGERNL